MVLCNYTNPSIVALHNHASHKKSNDIVKHPTWSTSSSRPQVAWALILNKWASRFNAISLFSITLDPKMESFYFLNLHNQMKWWTNITHMCIQTHIPSWTNIRDYMVLLHFDILHHSWCFMLNYVMVFQVLTYVLN